MSSSTNTTEIISLNNNQLLHVNMSNVSKLTNTNYLMWSLQVHALLDGYALASHLDAVPEIPTATITNGDDVTPNPDFVRWTRQDKLIYPEKESFSGSDVTKASRGSSKTSSSMEVVV